jgi:dihydrofolate reductase
VITSLIVAASENDVIGADGALPWHIPDDLRRFRALTTGHAVVLGRLTHESIVARLGRPLPGRTSVVLSSRAATGAGVTGADTEWAALAGTGMADGQVAWAGSLEHALTVARATERAARAADPAGARRAAEVFVLGGASVYDQVLPEVDRVDLTRVHRAVAGDTAMPAGWLDGFTLVSREVRPDADGGFSFLEYERRPG